MAYTALEYTSRSGGVESRIFDPNNYYKVQGIDGSETRSFKYYCAFSDSDWSTLSSSVPKDTGVIDLRNVSIQPTKSKVIVDVENYNMSEDVYDDANRFSHKSYSLPGKQNYNDGHFLNEVSFMFADKYNINYLLCEKATGSNYYTLELAAIGFENDNNIVQTDVINVFNSY